MKSDLQYLIEHLSIAMRSNDRDVHQKVNDAIASRWGVNECIMYAHAYELTLYAPRPALRAFAGALYHTTGVNHARNFARNYGHLSRHFRVNAASRNEQSRNEQPTTFLQRLRQRELTPASLRYQRAIGIEIEGFSHYTHRELEKALPYYCRVAADGSIRPTGGAEGAEIRMLLNRSAPEPRLMRALGILNERGFKTNRSCGLHVHLHAAHLTNAERQAKQTAMLAWLRLLSNFVPQSRRQNDYCRLDMSTAMARRNRYAAVNITTGGKQHHRSETALGHNGFYKSDDVDPAL
jgi:hypothetical protein